ncbi:hypothetical protein [Marinobacter sp.]|uniref:hypothetical protein n=1 Tax=Marinobacter sp. TaxID=50741 RepID=UPI002354C382|nr:hypothetical protein [Marinobacter sp.]
MGNTSSQALERSDISLVELAVIVVRWKVLFFSVFISILCAAGLYAFLSPAKQELVGVYQLAKAGDGEFLSDPEGVVSTINSVWIPELVSENEKNGQPALDLLATHPEATGLVQLATVARVIDKDFAVIVNQKILARLHGWQSKVFKDRSAQLERRIKRIASVIDQLEGSAASGEALAALLENKIEFEYELDQMQRGEILSEASLGKNQSSTPTQIILLAGLLLAFVLGVMLVFISEFISVVRKRATHVE